MMFIASALILAGRAPVRPKPARIPRATQWPFQGRGDRSTYPLNEGQS